ncbi:polyketide cyclase/dehydrase/lipid transport protein [Flavobacterium sp. 90]|uniref:SRPBCC family protein n=1 Tax=unclassified Flavobacterium TaxID=196869 RepID=UPI000EAD26A6|nr:MULTISPECIES: SRPBCC family protein [unclassified Flavobacterium]RKR11818.1 polyketide cyclase/dehydrase/lipid transport protein [Flavobacterium sp. 81]TCK55593.1 polyketide cyclase/dehydrase/lipid transport protein [Flavobacterium sp. 90]
MWSRSHSIVTKAVTKEQMWNLFVDVNNWHSWDTGIEYAKLEGNFEKGNHFLLRPKGGPNVKVELLEVVENKRFLDVTNFPLAKMYDEHIFEETPEGLKITNIIIVKGLLGFLWVKLVAKKIVDALPIDVQEQIKAASKL